VSDEQDTDAPMTPISSYDVDDANDTEITLGTGKMLALFFGLVILCAVFFGMGFSMGRSSVRSAPELLPSPTASGSSRPSASAGKPAEQQQTSGATQSKPTEPSQTTDSSSANVSGQGAQDQSSPQASAPPGIGYFVQVAAVSKQEDAEALVESLKGRQYSAFILSPSPDKFFHVQVGPFTDIKEAENMRAKLVSDGYNPILKK
jgi:DedD protein